MKKFIFILLLILLSGYAQAQVLHDIKWKYSAGKGDGYDVSQPFSYIFKVHYPEEICDGDDVMLSVQAMGGSLFSYRWYEVGKTTILSEDYFLSLNNCSYGSYNGKEYYCKVTDLFSGEVLDSDPVALNIVKRPTAKLTPSADTTLCYGESLRLVASPASSEMYYSWEGLGVVGTANSSIVTVKPEESTVYTVSVSAGNCASTASISVKIKKPEVKLPESIIYVQGEGKLNITPVTASVSPVFDWMVGGKSYPNRPVMDQVVKEVSKVIVTMKDGRCIAKDSCEVIPELYFGRFKGGDQDGFVQSDQKLLVSGIKPATLSVCVGETAYFSCNVTELSTYNYQWYKVNASGDDTKVAGGTDKLLTMENVGPAASGQYYCIVKDHDTKLEVQTDPATLSVLKIPVVEISFPAKDTTICAGQSLQLRASAAAGEGESLRWTGYDITSNNPTLREITVTPKEDTTVYELVLSNGTCRTSREIKVALQRVNVQLPDEMDILRGETIKISQETGTGKKYSWQVDGTTVSSSANFEYKPDKNVTITVIKQENNCVISDSCRVFLKEYGVGTSENQDEDGYTESILPFRIISIEGPEVVCVGDESLFSIAVSGYDVYEYAWKKVGAEDVILSDKNTYIIASSKMSSAGTYYCEVKDVRSGTVVKSDGVSLEVRPVPEAEIISPVQSPPTTEYSICRGEEVQLIASTAGDPKITTYLWEGLEITGPVTGKQTTVKPSETTMYTLVVSNGICASTAYLNINVKNIYVDLPEVLYTTSGVPLTIAPVSEVPAQAKLTWTWKERATPMTGSSIQNIFDKSTVVNVKMESESCVASDSVRVYVRNNFAYRGGYEDGFIESDLSFRIQGIEYPTVVCEGSEAQYSIRLSGSGIYAYAWKQVGLTTPLSTESTYTRQNCLLSDDGVRIFCEVTDVLVGSKLTSDTMDLVVRKGPNAQIVYPERGREFCIGSTIRIDARKTEESKENSLVEYTYNWEGENIVTTDRPYIVDVTPTKSQVYTLKVAYGECVDYDTINLQIRDPKIDIPSVMYINEGETLTVSAELSGATTNAQINWWQDLYFRPNLNPFVAAISESSLIVAQVAETIMGADKQCTSTDTMRVYVRTKKFYKGGDDDGFMESCEMPILNPDVPRILGCGGADSVSMLVAYSGTVRTFTWQKYSKETGTYVDVESASHITGLGTSQLTIDPLTESDYGDYQCKLSNECGSVVSKYSVSNGTMPELEIAMEDTVTFCEGQTNQHILLPVKENKSPITYRWYKKNPITGVVQQYTPAQEFDYNFLSFVTISTEHNALYLVEAENACGMIKDSVYLGVTPKLKLEKQPSDTIVCDGSAATFSVSVKYGGMQAFSLKRVVPDESKPSGFVVDSILSASGMSSYLFDAVSTKDAGYYVWTIKASCGDSITTNMFKLTVERPVQFISRTADTTLCYGNKVRLEVEAESPGNPDSKIFYTWEKASTGSLPHYDQWFEMAFVEGSEGAYICYAKNSCEKTRLDPPIVLSAHKQVNITYDIAQDPNDITKCEGESAVLSFHVDRPEYVDSVRWFKYVGGVNVPVANGGHISGADDYYLTFSELQLSDQGTYNVKVYYVCEVLELNPTKSLIVHERPKITKHIEEFFEPTTVCQGTEAILEVEAKGHEIKYVWLINKHMNSETSSKLSVVFDSTATYVCRVFNACEGEGVMSSKTVEVIKIDTFDFKVVGNRTNYCDGTQGIELMLAGSDTSYIYTLYKKGTAGADDIALITVDGRGQEPYLPLQFDPINFGYQEEGEYYVGAKNRVTGCEGKMRGAITLIKDARPAAFDLEVTKTICEEGDHGEITLLNSVQNIQNPIQYLLYKKKDAEWEMVPPPYMGTGDEIVWTDEVSEPGTYRVEARFTKGLGCATLMNNEVEVEMTELPDALALKLLRGKELYCDEEVYDIAVQLDPVGFENGLTYTLVKNGEVTGDELTEIPLVWAGLEPGNTYAVQVSNDWKCTKLSNEIAIDLKPLPNKKQLRENRYFCAGMEGDTTITLVAVDPDIKYEFTRKSDNTVVATHFKGAGTGITIRVPLEDQEYYVVATDTATKCATKMSNSVFIKSSKLEVKDGMVQIEISETQTALNLIVNNALGEPTIDWQPADHLLNVDDMYKPWVDVSDYTNVFTVTVSDSGCVKTGTIQITYKGEQLAVSIRESDCTTDVDTLKLCEGEKFSLCGKIFGGNGKAEDYYSEWLINGKKVVSTQLQNATAEVSGNIVFRTVNGRTATDTVYLKVYPAPGADLIMPEALCVVEGDDIEIELDGTNPSVKYTLEFSSTGTTYQKVSDADGTASGELTMTRAYASENLGYYRIKAEQEHDGKKCTSVHEKVKVERGPAKIEIDGAGTYCFRDEKDSIRLKDTELGTVYHLLHKGVDELDYEVVFGLGTLTGNGDDMHFIGNLSDGSYKVLAEIQGGNCVAMMNGEAYLQHMEAPVIGDLMSEHMEYCIEEGDEIKVAISLSDAVASNRYRLFRGTSTGQAEPLGSGWIFGQSGTIDFGSEFNEAGKYFAVVDNGYCRDSSDFVRIAVIPEMNATLEILSDLGYCEGGEGAEVELKLYPIDPILPYYIMSVEGGEQVAEFGTFKNDTAYFSGKLLKGTYLIKAILADCNKEIAEHFTIEEYALPAEVELLEPLASCDGAPISMGVKKAQKGIVYELYEEIDESISQMLASEEGDGKNLVLSEVGAIGTYHIIAEDPVTSCSRKLSGYEIAPQPKQFDLGATDTAYCAYSSTSGADLYLSGTEKDITYTLQKYNEIDGEYQDMDPSVLIVGTGTNNKTYFSGKFRAGKYQVVSNTCNGAVIGKPLEIINLELPNEDVAVAMNGNICADSLIQIVVSTENEVHYSLWNETTQIGSELIGDGTDKNWELNDLQEGTYEIRASRKRGKTTCAVILDTNVVVHELPEIGTLPAKSELCEHAHTTVVVKAMSPLSEVVYSLFDKSDDKLVTTAEHGPTSVSFNNVAPGTYYVTAQNGACKNVAGDIVVESVQAPDIEYVISEYDECGYAATGTLALRETVDSLYYCLTDPAGLEVSYVIPGGEREFTGMAYGRYYLRVQDRKTDCYSKYDTINLKAAVPLADTLLGVFAYCPDEGGAKLILNRSTSNIRYNIQYVDTREVIEEIWGGVGMNFNQRYTEGEYIFSAIREEVYGTCMTEDTITIEKLTIPGADMKISVAEAAPFCENSNYTITVKDAEAEVAYVLRRDGLPVDTIYGEGDIAFKPVSAAGQYTILPKNKGVCGQVALDTFIQINKLPSEILLEACSYCNPADGSEELSCELKLYDALETVRYILTDKTNNLDTVVGNYGFPYMTYKPRSVGKYYVKAEDINTGCSVMLDSAEITSGVEPEIFITGEDDMRCGQSAVVATSNGSQDGVNYYLYKNGYKMDGPLTDADGNDISFGEQTSPGIYQIYGENAGGCGVFMADSIIIHEPFIDDTLSMSGSYCEGDETSGIRLRLRKNVKGWRYYVEKDGVQGDTLYGDINGLSLYWDEIGGEDLRAGTYKLYSLDACGTATFMDSLDIDTNHLPTRFPLLEEDYILCQGDFGTITLSNSQPEVVYDLVLLAEGSANVLLKKEGTGDELLMSDQVVDAGAYFVIGRMKETGCLDTVSKINVATMPGIMDPGVSTADVCLADPDATLKVKITYRDRENVDYYLLRLNGADTTTVDSIMKDNPDHELKNEFEEQDEPGQYYILAEGPTCHKYFRAARVGTAPEIQTLDPVGEQTICKGGTVELKLTDSEEGVEYEIFQKVIIALDTNYNSTYIMKDGNGGELALGGITQAGIFMVRAKNGCEVDMDGELEVKLTEGYEIILQKESYKICALDDSTKIHILGVTNQNPDAKYYIFPPGASMDPADNEYSEIIAASGTGQSVESAKFYKTPGYYRVKGVDSYNCPELDSVKIEVLASPKVLDVELIGNGFICNSETVKDIEIKGAQPGMNYYLCSKNGDDITRITVQSVTSTKDLVFTVSLPGTYLIEAEYTDQPKSCPVRMNGEVTLSETPVNEYMLEAVEDSYCERPNITEKGKVRLANSSGGMSYQLYKNGSSYGLPIETVNDGDVVEWDNLEGGMPKMSSSSVAIPVTYTVYATDNLTGCRVPMNGSVEILAERKIQFNDDYMASTMPKCIGEGLRMEVSAFGGNIAYAWVKDKSPIAGANSYIYAKEDMDASDMGTYYCVMENKCGKDSTRNLVVEPNLIVEASQGIDTTKVCDLKAGDGPRKVRLASSAQNATSWEWYKNGSLLANVTDQGYIIDVTLTNGAGEYTCKASNSCGFVWDTCIVVVDSTPRIEDVIAITDTLCFGANYTLSAVSNHPIHWWRGANDLGVVGSTLQLTDIQASESGKYIAVSENVCGRAEMPVATLLIDDEIKLFDSQDNYYICVAKNETVKLSISTDPSERVSYLWKNAQGDVVGNTREIIVSASDLEGYTEPLQDFTVYYANKCSTGSKVVTLNISDSIKYQLSAEQIDLCIDNTIPDTTVSIEVKNANNITYAWIFENMEGDGTKDTISTTNSAKIKVASMSAGIYYVILQNGCSKITTKAINLRLDTVPEILVGLEPSRSLCAGSSCSMTVRAKGGSVVYQWYALKKDGTKVNLARELVFGTESEHEHTIKNVDISYDGAKIWCEVSNNCKTLTTDTMDLTVLPAPVVEMSPASAVICQGSETGIQVSLTEGFTPWTFKYKRVNGSDVFEDPAVYIVHGTDTTLKFTEAGDYIITEVSDGTCTAKKEMAKSKISLLKASEISMVAVDMPDPVCPGEPVTLKITIGGEPKGPWYMGVFRESDDNWASEMGFSEPIFLNKADTSFTFYPNMTETYVVWAQNEFADGMKCQSLNMTPPVKVNVMTAPELSMNTLTAEDKKFGVCKEVNLATLFGTAPKNITEDPYTGWYQANGEDVPGNKLKGDIKTYTIGYTLSVYGCTFKYTLDNVEFMPLPVVTMQKTSDIICSAASSAKVTIDASGQYPVKVSYRIWDINEDGTRELVTSLSDVEFTQTLSTKELNVKFNSQKEGRVFEIIRVEDRNGCTMPDLTALTDSIMFPGNPEFVLYSKLSSATSWNNPIENESFIIRKGDSVCLKAELTKGKKPWWLIVDNPGATPSNGFQRTDIMTDTVLASLKHAGLYEAFLQDGNECSTSILDYKPSIMLKVVDTAYLKVKAYLQGPAVGASNLMNSDVLDLVDKRDLAAWPNVGSRTIIDWVELELWQVLPVNGVETATLWDSIPALLLSDGTVVDKSGSEVIKMMGRVSGMTYRVAIRPRNHLPVWTKNMSLHLATQASPKTIDFTVASNIYVPYVDGVAEPLINYMKLNGDGSVSLYGGDANFDRLISSFDPNRITRENYSGETSTSGTLLLDVNYNGVLEWPGYNVSGGSQEDWVIMYNNRIRFTTVPFRNINW